MHWAPWLGSSSSMLGVIRRDAEVRNYRRRQSGLQIRNTGSIWTSGDTSQVRSSCDSGDAAASRCLILQTERQARARSRVDLSLDVKRGIPRNRRNALRSRCAEASNETAIGGRRTRHARHKIGSRGSSSAMSAAITCSWLLSGYVRSAISCASATLRTTCKTPGGNGSGQTPFTGRSAASARSVRDPRSLRVARLGEAARSRPDARPWLGSRIFEGHARTDRSRWPACSRSCRDDRRLPTGVATTERTPAARHRGRRAVAPHCGVARRRPRPNDGFFAARLAPPR